jgi:hypothetical protein
MKTLNTLLNFLNFLQLRRINRRLAGPEVIVITQRPGLLEGPYQAGKIQGPPPELQDSWTTADETEWQTRLSNPALSKEQRGAVLNNFFAARALSLAPALTPEYVEAMSRMRAEQKARREEELNEAAIRALELKFNS